MMAMLTQVPYADPRDLERVVDFLLRCRATYPQGAYPAVTRLRTLLLARLWAPARDARVWANSTGRLMGFAALFPPGPTYPFLPLTFIADAHGPSDDLTGAMVDWALGRARERAAVDAGAPPAMLHVEIDAADHAARDLVERRGFTRKPVQTLYMTRPLAGWLPEPMLPEGFTLHQAPASVDLERYLVPYAPWFHRWGLAQRRRLMASPDYDPSLDLVVETADGTLAAYCECSTSRTEWARGGPRTGSIDMVATLPEYRGRGIGRALVSAALSRLHIAGADTVQLFTESTNVSAQRIYAALGFQTIRTGWWYARAVSLADG